MNEFQKKQIEEIVEEYKKTNPTDYLMAVEQIKRVRKNQRDKFASMPRGESSVIERKLIEIPQLLFNVMLNKLPKEIMDNYFTKEGSRWFARRYPEFRVAEKI